MGSVLCWCQCVHRAHADTNPTSGKCWASVTRAGQHSFKTEQCILLDAHDYNAQCRPTHDTPTQYRLKVGPPSVTPVLPRTSIVSQRMSTRRKLCGFKAERVFRGIKKHWAFNPKAGLMLGKWRKHASTCGLILSSIHCLHDFEHKQDSQLNSSVLITVWRVVIEKSVTGLPAK